jgi:hypothetical protein
MIEYPFPFSIEYSIYFGEDSLLSACPPVRLSACLTVGAVSDIWYPLPLWPVGDFLAWQYNTTLTHAPQGTCLSLGPPGVIHLWSSPLPEILSAVCLQSCRWICVFIASPSFFYFLKRDVDCLWRSYLRLRAIWKQIQKTKNGYLHSWFSSQVEPSSRFALTEECPPTPFTTHA